MKEYYAKRISRYIETLSENMPIEVGNIHKREFPDIPEAAYYKAIERMKNSGVLVHLTKGMYYRPKHSRYGIVPISDEEIAKYYMKNGHGMIIGLRLFNEKGITTQIGKRIEVLTDKLNGEIKNAGNVTVRRSGVVLTAETVPAIEALEILQHYRKVEDVNHKKLIAYMKAFSTCYSDDAMNKVLQNRKYKKSTIAFLKRFLDYYNSENTLGKYLSGLSKYAIPTMEELYETA